MSSSKKNNTRTLQPFDAADLLALDKEYKGVDVKFDPPGHVHWHREIDTEQLVRLVRNHRLTDRALQQLANYSRVDTTVLAALADNEETPASVRKLLARNTGTPSEILTKLLASAPELAPTIAKNPALDAEAVCDIAQHGHEDARLALLSRSYIPGSILRTLARSPCIHTRLSVAGHKSTPSDILAGLSNDPMRRVREAVAGRSSLRQETMAKLAKDPSPHVLVTLSRNRATPLSIHRELAKHPNEYVQRDVVKRAGHDAQVAEILSQSDFPSVRKAVAAVSSTPGKGSQGIRTSNEIILIRKVTKNPETSAQTLLELIDKADAHIAQWVLEHPNCNDEVAAAAACSPDPAVRAIAKRFDKSGSGTLH
jgi:hypothetical protein